MLWVTDRAKVQALVDKTGYADQVQLRDTDVPLTEVEALADQVLAVVKADSVVSNSLVGPDFENYPLVVARLPKDEASDELVARIEAMATPAVKVQVILD